MGDAFWGVCCHAHFKGEIYIPNNKDIDDPLDKIITDPAMRKSQHILISIVLLSIFLMPLIHGFHSHEEGDTESFAVDCQICAQVYEEKLIDDAFELIRALSVSAFSKNLHQVVPQKFFDGDFSSRAPPALS